MNPINFQIITSSGYDIKKSLLEKEEPQEYIYYGVR